MAVKAQCLLNILILILLWGGGAVKIIFYSIPSFPYNPQYAFLLCSHSNGYNQEKNKFQGARFGGVVPVKTAKSQ